MSKPKFQVLVIDPPYAFSDKLQHSATKRGAAANYQTLTNAELLKLPIKDIADPNGALLALWVPSSLLQLGLDLMKTYGFDHKQTVIWVKCTISPFKGIVRTFEKWYMQYKNNLTQKTTWRQILKNSVNISDLLSFNKAKPYLTNMLGFGMGKLFRNTHEICLIGVNNTAIYKQLLNKSQRTVFFSPNMRHSQKPEDLQDSLDVMFNNLNKIEVFARRDRAGWICVGNECPSTRGQDIRTSLSNLI